MFNGAQKTVEAQPSAPKMVDACRGVQGLLPRGLAPRFTTQLEGGRARSDRGWKRGQHENGMVVVGSEDCQRGFVVKRLRCCALVPLERPCGRDEQEALLPRLTGGPGSLASLHTTSSTT